MITYHEAFRDLQHVVLEESWVLQVWPATMSLVFELEAVLTEKHERYEGPARGEVHSWIPAKLVLFSDAAIDYAANGRRPAPSEIESPDYGNIDVFCSLDETGWWILSSNWGEVRIHAPVVSLVA